MKASPLVCRFLQDEWSVLQTLAAVLHTCDISFAAEGEGSRVTNPEKVELGRYSGCEYTVCK